MTVGFFYFRVEVAWGNDPLDRPTSLEWSDLADVSDGIMGLNIKRGTRVLSSQVEAGKASWMADNRRRHLDPSNTASSLYPNVKIRRRVRVTIVYPVGGPGYSDVYGDVYEGGADEEHVLFTGFVEGWPIEWSREVGWVKVSASDLLSIIAGLDLPASVLEVVTRHLGAVAYWPMSESIFTGSADDVIGIRDGVYVGAVQQGQQVVPFDARSCPRFAAPMVDGLVTPAMVVRDFTCPDEASFSVWFKWNPGDDSTARPPLIMLQDGDDPEIPSGGFTAPISVLVYLVDDSFFDYRQQFRIIVTDGTHQARLGVPVAFQLLDGAPHHVVFSFDASTKTFNIDCDGLRVSGFTDTGEGGTTPIASVDVSAAVAGCDNLSTGWGIDYQGAVAVATSADVGHLAFFDRVLTGTEAQQLYEAGTTAWSGDTTGERLHRILDWLGVDALDRDIDTGTQVCGPTLLGSQNAGEYIRWLQATEQNVCFVNGDGKLRFPNRLPDSPSIVQVFSDDPVGDDGVPVGPVRPDRNWSRIVNRLTVGRENGADQVVENAASVAEHGPLAGATGGKISTLHASATDARATGQRIVDRHGVERTYIDAVKLDGIGSLYTRASMVGVEIGDGTTTIVRPTGGGDPIEQTGIVEHLEYDAPRAQELTTTYSLLDYPLEP